MVSKQSVRLWGAPEADKRLWKGRKLVPTRTLKEGGFEKAFPAEIDNIELADSRITAG